VRNVYTQYTRGFDTNVPFQDPDAPLPALYENLGMPVIKIIVSGGAIFALCTRYLPTRCIIYIILYNVVVISLLFFFYYYYFVYSLCHNILQSFGCNISTASHLVRDGQRRFTFQVLVEHKLQDQNSSDIDGHLRSFRR